MIETRAPGKLFIVGEYAVVEAGEPAVLVAIDRYLRVSLTERDAPAGAGVAQPASDHVRAAILAVDELRTARGLAERYFDIEIDSELDGPDGRKYGLGSSAAVTVATVEALDRLYGLGLDPLERFRVAMLATIEVSPKASGGDLAASTFGGWIRYSSPDRSALRAHRAAHGIVSALQCEAWQHCEVRSLPAPQTLRLLVGWTGSPASTESLVESVEATTTPDRDAESRRAFLSLSRACVDDFCRALEAGSQASDRACTAIRDARTLLQRLGEDRGIVIETPALRLLCEVAEQHGAAAKSSGAGGGDCGIALAMPGSDIPGILRGWEQHNITPLDLEVHGASRSSKGDANEH